MNPILEGGIKWVFVAYVVFSLAVGVVEMAGREVRAISVQKSDVL